MPDADGDEASSAFPLALCTVVLVPWVLVKLRAALRRQPSTEPAAWASLGFSSGAPIVAGAKKRQGLWPRWLSIWNAAFVCLIATEAQLLINASAQPPVAEPFDPHDVLGVPSGAPTEEVRAAYRRLALQNHPDKNPDPAASEVFARVVKAHAILTNPVAARNFERYGSPDGYQGRPAFGIALPGWLMGEHSLLPLVALVLLLPVLAWLSMRDTHAADARRLATAAQDAYLRAVLGVGSADASGAEVQRAARAALRGVGGVKALRPSAVNRAERLVPLACAAFDAVEFEALERAPTQAALREVVAAVVAAAAAAAGRGGGGVEGGGGAGGGDGVRKPKAAPSDKRGGRRGKAGRGKGGRKAAGGAEEDAEAEAGAEGEEVVASAQSGAAATVGAIPHGRPFTAGEARALLLHAHLNRLRVPAPLERQSSALLRHAPAVCESLALTALLIRALPVRDGLKPALELAQRVCQALPAAESALLQAPHFTPDRARLAAAHGIVEVRDLVRGAAAEPDAAPPPGGGEAAAERERLRAARRRRSQLLGGPLGLREREAGDVHAFCDGAFPRAALRVVCELAGEDEGEQIVEGDVLTVRATLALRHRSGSAHGAARRRLPAHTPLLPRACDETWLIALSSAAGGNAAGGGVLAWKRAPRAEAWRDSAGGCEWTAELRTVATEAGTLRMGVHAVCTSYVGADVAETVEVEVGKRRRRRAEAVGARAADNSEEDDSGGSDDDDVSGGGGDTDSDDDGGGNDVDEAVESDDDASTSS